MTKWGEPKANNQPVATRGLLTCAAVTPLSDLLHTLPVGRTAKIVKIMYFNPTAGDITFILGTWDNTLPVGGWVGLFPTILSLAGLGGLWIETEIPAIEFVNDRQALAVGMTGDIRIQCSAVGLIIRLEVQEKGA